MRQRRTEKDRQGSKRRRLALPPIVIGAAAVIFFACTPRSLVKQLGYSSRDQLLIINADDFGVSPAVNAGTLKALKYGLVKSASIIVPVPYFQEAAKMVRDNPELDVGIHLTLSCGYGQDNSGPVLSADKVPSLVTRDGYFHPSGELRHVSREEAINEFRAQIEKAIAAGVHPSHLDSHMGCYEYRFDLFRAAIQIAEEYGLPMRNGVTLRKGLVRHAGVFCNDRFSMFYDNQDDHADASRRERVYHDYFKHLKPGVNEVAVHIAEPITARMDDPSERGLRADGLRIFTDPKTRALLEQLGVKLIGYRELQQVQINKKEPRK